MRLEIRQKIICGPNIVEREIILEEDHTLNQVRVQTQNERYAPFIPEIPLDNLEVSQSPDFVYYLPSSGNVNSESI